MAGTLGTVLKRLTQWHMTLAGCYGKQGIVEYRVVFVRGIALLCVGAG